MELNIFLENLFISFLVLNTYKTVKNFQKCRNTRRKVQILLKPSSLSLVHECEYFAELFRKPAGRTDQVPLVRLSKKGFYFSGLYLFFLFSPFSLGSVLLHSRCQFQRPSFVWQASESTYIIMYMHMDIIWRVHGYVYGYYPRF